MFFVGVNESTKRNMTMRVLVKVSTSHDVPTGIIGTDSVRLNNSIEKEYRIVDKIFRHNFWDIAERYVVVPGSKLVLDGTYESFNYGYVVLLPTYVELIAIELVDEQSKFAMGLNQ